MRRAVLVPLALLAGACTGSDTAPPTEYGILFSSSRDGDFEIYVMDPDGKTVRQLTKNGSEEGAETDPEEEPDDYQPVWSPDGTRIAFTSTRDNEGDSFDSGEIYVMNADGSGQERLTQNSIGEGSPRWSPDGDWIAFARRPEAGADRIELAIMRSNGANSRMLVRQGQAIFNLDWSPDGTRIAFTSCNYGQTLDCEIWVTDVDGGEPGRLTDSGGRSSQPAWSPDGSKIAFVSDRDENGKCFFHDCFGHNGEIYVMDADGSNETRLTDDPGEDASPTWSPDGRRIAFSGLRNVEGAVDAPAENYEIYVMDADGGNLQQLTRNTSWDWQLDWQ